MKMTLESLRMIKFEEPLKVHVFLDEDSQR